MAKFNKSSFLSGAMGGAGIGATVGGPWGAVAGGVLGGIGGGLMGDDEDPMVAEAKAENARQMAIRDAISRQLMPGIQSDLAGQESLSMRSAREREEGLQRSIYGRDVDAQRQALIDQLARVGGGTGRTSANITSPAAQARLAQLDAQRARGLSEFGIRSSAETARARENARQNAQQRLLALGGFQAGGYNPVPRDQSGDALSQGAGMLFQQGLEEILRRRRAGSATRGALPDGVIQPSFRTTGPATTSPNLRVLP